MSDVVAGSDPGGADDVADEASLRFRAAMDLLLNCPLTAPGPRLALHHEQMKFDNVLAFSSVMS